MLRMNKESPDARPKEIPELKECDWEDIVARIEEEEVCLSKKIAESDNRKQRADW